MRAAGKFIFVLLMFSYFAACAPVRFEDSPSVSCSASDVACIKKCTGEDCIQSFSVNRTVGLVPVDILVVNDNSGSMSGLQSLFASAFDGFLQSLELAGLNYRIAMTTTDISSTFSQMDGPELISRENGPGPYNGYGSLQDGNLINFGSGKKFVSVTDSNRSALFINNVRRPETIACEQSAFKNCPSSDERGIFALNLVLDRSASQFMRESAALAVIVLSNEDERGISWLNTSTNPSDVRHKQLYPAKNYDRPETFVSRFRSKFPGKTLAVHSIIVKPGDTQCLNQLSDPAKYIFARAGYAYADLSARTGGTIGSICESNYTNQLRAISDDIQAQVLALPFSCRPENDQYTVDIIPQPSQSVTWTANWTSMTLTSNQALPPGTSVTLKYDCRVE